MNLDKLDLQTERYIINRFISTYKKLILKEKWKAYPYDREYLISNFGRVKYKNKLLKITLDNNGYCRVRIKGIPYGALLHRIVAITWLSNKNNYSEVNHKDGNKQNNKFYNLEWCTRQYNIKHAFKLGLNKTSDLCKEKARNRMIEHNKNRNTYKYYEEHKNESLHKAFPPVYQFDLDGKFIAKYRTTGEVHRQIGLNGSAISKCCTHRLKTSQGYIWRYESEVVKENGTYRFTN